MKKFRVSYRVIKYSDCFVEVEAETEEEADYVAQHGTGNDWLIDDTANTEWERVEKHFGYENYPFKVIEIE